MPSPATRTLLIDDPSFTYVCHNGQFTTRHLRLWRTNTGAAVAVVTEGIDDSGMSITNAAERVWAAVQRQYADPSITIPVVEHYPAEDALPERFSTITLGLNGEPCWTHLPAALLLLSIGLDAYPA